MHSCVQWKSSGSAQVNTLAPKRALLLLVLALLCLVGCTARGEQDDRVIVYDALRPDGYSRALDGLLANHLIDGQDTGLLDSLNQGKAIATTDLVAVPALRSNERLHWYPQILASVVLAVDRDVTSETLSGWQDLAHTTNPVGFQAVLPDERELAAAMSYGLEGEGFTLDAMTKMLRDLHVRGLLRTDGEPAPIQICFDDEAADRIQNGENIEIIVPAEGTLSFTKGILAPYEIEFPPNMDNALIAAGMRLVDGRAHDIYPADYSRAARVSDHDYVNATTHNMGSTIQRQVMRLHLYVSADGFEQQLHPVLFLMVFLVWMTTILHRTMNRNIRLAMLASGLLIVGWMLTRMIKYQLLYPGALHRHLWYGYYLFMLGLPLVFLWLALALDQSVTTFRFPKVVLPFALVNAALLALVMSNDLHRLAFTFDDPDGWLIDYEYGPIYYGIFGVIAAESLVALAILLQKNWASPRKKDFLFLLPCYLLLLAYAVGYAAKWDFARESDVTMVTGVLLLAFMEGILQTGLVPTNSKYRKLFFLSPLKMRILGADQKVAFSSAQAPTLSYAELRELRSRATKSPLLQGADTLLYAKPIRGGLVVWQEDISKLNRMYEQLSVTTENLRAANAMLSKEKQVRSERLRAQEAERLYSVLDAEIAEKMALLGAQVRSLIEQKAPVSPEKLACLTMLLCYIKRRCNFYFLEQTDQAMPVDELFVYLDEMDELASHAGTHVAVSCGFSGALSVRQATLFYDFFYSALSWVGSTSEQYVTGQLLAEAGRVKLMLMLPRLSTAPTLSPGLQSALNVAQGTFIVKDLDDSVGISLSFASVDGGQHG
ncbi:MAG: hypothetical protein LBV00_02675 [Propionibacteriaceae bacterium]|jgi:hypothetical protein|nr:hypothetical protein [Propionibacteriaceae bacterium]